jgi:hypothetical protein
MSSSGLNLPLPNGDIAARLEEAASLLETQEESPFRARAYRTAARTVRELDRPIHRILETEGAEGLTQLPGIGTALARVIQELALTGRSVVLDRLRAQDDPEQVLASVPGIGPELAARIHRQLGVESLESLEQAAHDGLLAEVPGLGAKRVRAIRETLAGRLGRNPRRASVRSPLLEEEPPDVAELLDVDREYREKAAGGKLRRITPRRFNRAGEAWLPVLNTRRGKRRYTALYSNTALAHQLGKTEDWVVLYYGPRGRERQNTVVTAGAGPLKGRRVVRGREADCVAYYAEAAAPLGER